MTQILLRRVQVI